MIAKYGSHPSRGAWIEIWFVCRRGMQTCGRTPHGVRGLKLEVPAGQQTAGVSHPSRGAWIEICVSLLVLVPSAKSHPSRGAWIEITRRTGSPLPSRSHPSRGAWIEIGVPGGSGTLTRCRTPHGVRGLKYPVLCFFIGVPVSHPSRGAWIEMFNRVSHLSEHLSHPSRGAWIEIG